MCKVQMLRALVKQRLTAAAEEIFVLFERTIAEYEEELSRSKEENERQQKLLDAVFNPQLQLHRADVQQLLVVKEEVPTEQQLSLSLDQEDPEPPHIKGEQEELWTSQEVEQLQWLEEADGNFPFTSVPVKSEDEVKPQFSQLHDSQTENREKDHLKTKADREDCGESKSAMISDPDGLLQPATRDKTSPSSESENDDGKHWEETKEPQSGSNFLQNSEMRPVSGIEYNTGETSVSSSECARSFGHKEHLQKHTGIQSGGKPFSYSVCGKKFAKSSSLISHERFHSDGKPFSCPVCKTGFGYSTHLARHMRIHTGEKPFSCSVCGKRFTQKEHLKGHIFVHTGEKPFSCSVCGKRFTQKEHLKGHLLVHTGEKPFSCSVCDKSFSRLHNAKKHKCVGESSRKT